jgi:hypothetical protein
VSFAEPTNEPEWMLRPLGDISHTILADRGHQILERLAEVGVPLPLDHRLAQAIRYLDVPENGSPTASEPERATTMAAATAALLEALAVVEAHRASRSQRHLFTLDRLRQLVQGRLVVSTGSHDDDANRRFETYVAALLVMGGFAVSDAEPDWHVLYANGEWLGLAVKRINTASERAIRDRVQEAARQIERAKLRGLVVINVDALTGDLTPGLPPEEFGPAFDAAAAHVLSRVGALADRAHIVGAYLFGSGMRFRFAEDGAASLHMAVVHKVLPLCDDAELPALGPFLERMQLKVRLALQGITTLASPGSRGTTGLPHLDGPSLRNSGERRAE